MSHRGRASHPTWHVHGRRRSVLLVVLGSLAWIEACVEREHLLGPSRPDTLVAAEPIASNPVTGPLLAHLATAPGGSSGRGTSVSDVVYVSLPPGTVPDGGLAIIRNTRTDVEVPAAMAEGGFDPVPIEAVAGDTLVLQVSLAGGGRESFSLAVPATRVPIVVRTDPPPQKRDVPLNAAIVIVFSEPVDPGTLSGIRLLRGGAVVSAGVVLAADGLRATLTPDQPLAPNTDYALSIPNGVTDLSGDPLAQPVLMQFTTGTTVIVASVATDPVALLTLDGNLRTFTMRAVIDNHGLVTGTFNIFFPEHGWRYFGPVTCFTIVDGNAAWVAGIIEGATLPELVGVGLGWRAVDNGVPGSGLADQLSFAYPLEAGTVTPQQFCATTPLTDPDPDAGTVDEIVLNDVISGDVVVNPSGAPPPPPAGGMSEIAFAAVPDGGIQVINADGSGGRRLTSQPGDFSPSWSPDGTRLVFHRQDAGGGDWDIYVINSDGTGVMALTSDVSSDFEPAWSPDGTRIAFARDGAIHVMHADGSAVTRVTDGPDAHPFWAPDGSRIAFARWGPGSGGTTSGIYIVNVDGSGLTELTNAPGFHDTPAWSPDGGRIAFQRTPDQPGGVGALYVMNADGTGVTQVTPGGQTPAWSPDGRMIVYEYYGMTVIYADGSGATMRGLGYAPAWSATGTVPPGPQPFLTIEKAGGDRQIDTVGATLAQPLSVRVVHDDGSPVRGVRVAWLLFAGGEPGYPALSADLVETDTAGIASAFLTLGPSAGLVTVHAAVRDGSAHNAGVEFTALATPAPSDTTGAATGAKP